MNIYINESEVNKSIISVNTGLNYGRFEDEGLGIDHYKIILTFQEFIETIELEYNSVRDEIKRDDELQKETSGFTTINYGSITELLQNNQTLHTIMTTYLDRILFSKLFYHSNNSSFIINSTDLVEVVNNKIEISGRCYSKNRFSSPLVS
jgi:hypothetical protein